MKNRKKRSFFLMLLWMALICIPVQADANRTTFTATVPEQPADTLEAPTGAKILGEIPLPAGWVWEQPDIELVPDTDIMAAALYREENGRVLAERTVMIRIPKTPKPTVIPDMEYPPASGSDTSWDKDKEDGLFIKVSEDLGEVTEVFVDGQILDKNHYTVSGKPPVVTLKPEFLETLKDGKHIVRIQGENGYTEAAITVEKEISQTTPTGAPDKKPDNTLQQGTATGSEAVKTGDETPVMWLIVFLLLSGALLCAVVLRKNAAGK